MIRYNKSQLSLLISVICNNAVYDGAIIHLLHSTKNPFLVLSDKEVYNNFNGYCRTIWFSKNYPSKERRTYIKKVRDSIFKVSFEELPLLINDPEIAPIIAWRLENNL
jgi:hypothetical protein